ncbi:aldose epimerase family protein [Mucilaginibacter myungsuensis]|uniref:Aldose 1-epimerase n=1 Tax=Mucilaginibacter myungsuensis TaxID=649104 RepID=A0A929KU29_9SPHI|nr:aldose epimerase family protein [Mucilaginibacter myungsuensis]MBE9661586.1 galactose mutarotase [Mucilaginibacter myungsuensis]MDN3597731.1 aldose epimerase family protein [Mucilaginibacter myungsuensis]
MNRLIILYTWVCFVVSVPVVRADGRPRSAKPTITKTPYGELEGKKIYEYTLTNANGMQVKVINYGATITDIITPDKDGKLASVVLGFDSLKVYTGRMNALMGAVVGRVANRITNKRFTIDGQEYVLSGNIHGGAKGFNKRIWDIEEVPGNKEVALKVTYFSPDGEEGYPGNLKVTITYTLTNNNELKLDYKATTDKATPLILTNHTYFNLSGSKDDKVLDTELSIASDKFLEAKPGPMPTGKLLDVKGTPFDFTSPRKIGERILDTAKQLTQVNGYDLTFALRNQSGKLAKIATAYEPLSGREMQVYTTEPGLVFYTGNHLNPGVIGRGGKASTKNAAFCLETQHYPDSPNIPQFPNSIVRPGETFSSQTVYKFSVRK